MVTVEEWKVKRRKKRKEEKRETHFPFHCFLFSFFFLFFSPFSSFSFLPLFSPLHSTCLSTVATQSKTHLTIHNQMADSSKVILKANLPRTRDLSFVGRYHHNFGFENGLFEYLLHQKDIWGDKLFYFNEEALPQWIRSGKHRTRGVNSCNADSTMPDVEAVEVLQLDFELIFGLFAGVDFNVGKDGKFRDVELSSGAQAPLKDIVGRNGLVLNAGGSVTSMKWLPYGDVPHLAVAVINSKGDLSSMISDPSLSLFPHDMPGDIKSALQIWRYSPEAMRMELSQVYDTSLFGATSALNWVPMKCMDPDTLGVVAGNFSDGKFHAFKVSNHISESAVYYQVTKASWTISILDERVGHPRTLLPITCYDFLDDKRVIVGTLDGAVAEYLLPSAPTHEELDEPSFFVYIADSCVNSVSVGESSNSRVILINTATTQGFALEYENIRQGRVDSNFTISHLNPLYHSGYRIYVYPDSAESIGYTFIRHPHEKHTLLLKGEMVSSFHISEYLNHPLAIIGNVLGHVYVMNIGRKIFGVPKAHNRLVVPLRVWSLKMADKKLSLCGDYVKTTTDKNDSTWSFTPPEVVISASAWNESLSGSSTYAFGTYSGLVVVERVDPAAA